MSGSIRVAVQRTLSGALATRIDTMNRNLLKSASRPL
jgi:hypothetical protein